MLKKSLLLITATLLLAPQGSAASGGSAPCITALEQPIAAGGINGVQSVFAADVNGDLAVDVLTASFGDDRITLFLNNGDDPPTFTEQIITDRADSAASVFAIDVDADGDLDVLSASSNDNTIALYENDGNLKPLFTRRVVSLNARRALSVFAADLTGECSIADPGPDDPACRLEVLSASFADNKIAWYERSGNTFTENVLSATASGAASVHAADLDGDGDIDPLSASRLSNRVTWYENVPFDPGEAEPTEDDPLIEFNTHVISSSVSGATSVVAADFTGDGKADVAVAAAGSNKIILFPNDGNPAADPAVLPTFAVQRLVTNSALGVRQIVAVDLDGDTDQDLLVASEADSTVAWYENGGTGVVWTRRLIDSAVVGARSVTVGRLNADAQLEVITAASVAGSRARNDRVSWYEETVPGSGTWIATDIAVEAVAPEVLVVADVDDDGDDDVVSSSTIDDSLRLYVNDGMTPPTFAERIIATNARGVRSIFVVDMNGDDLLDVLSASATDDRIVLHETDPGLAVWTQEVISVNAAGASFVYAADVDGDLDLDVLSASSDDNKIAWYENGGTPNWAETAISNSVSGASAVIAADLDGEGNVDVVAAAPDDDRIWWFANAGTATDFEDGVVINPDPIFSNLGRADGVAWLDSVDFDGDGRVDLVSASTNDDTVAWYRNLEVEVEVDDGKGGTTTETVVQFTEFTITATADFARFVAVSDLNGDALPDLIAVSSADDTVALYETSLVTDPAEGATPVLFSETLLTTRADEARAAGAGDLNNDGFTDVATAFRFGIDWHEGNVEETCDSFDGAPVGGDDRIDGLELIWLAMAFGETSGPPSTAWWATIDVNADGIIDGDDLAILTDIGVWGRSSDPTAQDFCNFTCPPR